MPQKKNAVAAEMVRAKTGSVMGDLVGACAIMKALPYSYNLDLQEVTPAVWRALDDTTDSLRVLAGMVSSLSPRHRALRGSVANDNSTAVALADYLVEERGISFRQAHAIVGRLVKTSVETGRPLQEVAPSRMAAVSAKFGKRVTIGADAARELLAPEHFLRSIATDGGSNPRLIAGGLRTREKDLELTKSALSGMRSSLRASDRKLYAIASGLAREVKIKS
jgi:argininosuccinate lyase